MFRGGGGRVVISCGIFITGGLRIRSGVELYLESGIDIRTCDNVQSKVATSTPANLKSHPL